jgi:hypothetical protein
MTRIFGLSERTAAGASHKTEVRVLVCWALLTLIRAFAVLALRVLLARISDTPRARDHHAVRA